MAMQLVITNHSKETILMETIQINNNHWPPTTEGREDLDNLILVVFCFFTAFFCYHALIPLVFPEMACSYQIYGNAPEPKISQVISAYNIFSFSSGCWYRPTSFFLFPYLLSENYFNPAGIVSYNIIFFAFTCAMVPIFFLKKSNLTTKILASIFILTSPSLTDIILFQVIDPIYIIFSILFIVAFEKMVTKLAKLTIFDFFILILLYLAAITSKESTIIIPIIAPLYTAINNGKYVLNCNTSLKRIYLLATIFISLSAGYYLLYLYTRGVIANRIYTDMPSIRKLPKVIMLVYATLNVNATKLPGYKLSTAGYTTLGNITWATIWLIMTGLLAWCNKIINHINFICFVLIISSLYLLSGLAGGHFHHVFPMLICFAVLVGRLITFSDNENINKLSSFNKIFMMSIQISIIICLVISCKTYASHLLELGYNSNALKINTSLFHDKTIYDIAHRDNTYLLIESPKWDIGGGAGVLHYYGRNPGGKEKEEYVDKITPKKISEIAKNNPNVIIYGLTPDSGNPPYKISQLWPPATPSKILADTH